MESEPCVQLHLNFLLFPLPPASLLAALFLPLSMHGELCLCPITTSKRGRSVQPCLPPYLFLLFIPPTRVMGNIF